MTMYDMTAIERRRAKKSTPIFCEKPHKNWGPGSKKRPALMTRITALTTPSEAAADDAPLDLY